MKSDNELGKELDDILIERNRIQKELDDIQLKLKVFEDSMYFNVCDITKILAKLVSNKENTSYYPVFYDDRNIGRSFDAALNIGIVRAEYENKASCKFSNYLNIECISNDDKEPLFIGAIYYTYLTKVGKGQDPYKVDITFTSLLKKYNIPDVLSKPGICNCTFIDYPYINDFVEYLFTLQVQNSGRHLTYDEMQLALYDFLKLESQKEVKTSKVKVRKIKKSNNKES